MANEIQEGKWIEVFRAGDYSRTHDMKVSNAEVQAMADNYNPKYREAMLKIGHDPMFGKETEAHGWVTDLKSVAGSLFAKFKGLSEDVKRLTASGALKKRSAEIMDARFSDSGAPEFWGVALLGGSQPGVPAMAGFTDGGEQTCFVEFVEPGSNLDAPESTATEETKGANMADEAKIAELQEQTTQLNAKIEALEKRPATTQEEFDALKTQAATAETEKTELSNTLKQERRANVEQTVEGVFSALRTAGKMAPAFENGGIKPVLISLAENDVKVDVDGKEVAAFEVMCSFLNQLPKLIDFKTEIVPDGTVPDAVPLSGDATKRYTHSVDPESAKIHEEAVKLQAADKTLTYRDACNQAAEKVMVN